MTDAEFEAFRFSEAIAKMLDARKELEEAIRNHPNTRITETPEIMHEKYLEAAGILYQIAKGL